MCYSIQRCYSIQSAPITKLYALLLTTEPCLSSECTIGGPLLHTYTYMYAYKHIHVHNYNHIHMYIHTYIHTY